MDEQPIEQESARLRRWQVVVAVEHEWRLLPWIHADWKSASDTANAAQDKYNGATMIVEVVGADPGEQSGASDKSRGKQFDSSAWLALLARWLAVERELRDEQLKALTRGDEKAAEQWRAQWCGLKPRLDDLAEEIGRASKANIGLSNPPLH